MLICVSDMFQGVYLLLTWTIEIWTPKLTVLRWNSRGDSKNILRPDFSAKLCGSSSAESPQDEWVEERDWVWPLVTRDRPSHGRPKYV